MSSETLLNEDLRAEIRACFPRYPTRQAVVLPALHAVNHRLGYVPRQAVVEIAELLDLSPAQVQDTLSFYEFFPQDRPQGRLRVWVCRSISCAACGGEEMLEYLAERLSIRPGQTTADGRVTLEFGECLGLCDVAPAMLAGGVVYKNLTRAKIDEFVQSLRTE
ncbi:MAG: NAD(P)H-dependent oxidoreductase subunit E [Thermoguttaceae bacterium]|jgi:NADH-quinone oxidoreductase subunit E